MTALAYFTSLASEPKRLDGFYTLSWLHLGQKIKFFPLCYRKKWRPIFSYSKGRESCASTAGGSSLQATCTRTKVITPRNTEKEVRIPCRRTFFSLEQWSKAIHSLFVTSLGDSERRASPHSSRQINYQKRNNVQSPTYLFILISSEASDLVDNNMLYKK